MSSIKRLNIGVVDYGMGNLHSVAKGLSSQGGRVFVSDQIALLQRAQILVVPGVGSFGAAMRILKKKRMDGFIKQWIKASRPYLGICLGFQMLFEGSQEAPGISGLGVFKGRVEQFDRKKLRKNRLPVPHMGWNTLKFQRKDGFLNGLKPEDYFYFVHSFFPVPKDRKLILTETRYGETFCSAISTPTLFASQFHPEKSGLIGLKVLKNVLVTLSKHV